MAQANNVPLRLALVLQGFLLQQIGYSNFEQLRQYVGSPDLEGLDDEGTSRICIALQGRLPRQGGLSREDLLRYDAHIRQHTAHINEGREQQIVWKYFQYIALLFSEIYLDRYFNGREALLSQLNAFLLGPFRQQGGYADFPKYTEQDLNKVALWTATGSGKTLMMHVNILQFLHYAKAAKQKFNRILLITPNEGLSKQHLDDFCLSHIPATSFSKQGGQLFRGDVVEIIEVTKLSDKDGEKTVAVDSFEDNNFVLVDEAHRGSTGDKWKEKRESLSRRGFSFEYSATLGQAVGAASTKARPALLAEYAKSTLLDYSYRRFYTDGYGKEYEILNLRQTNHDAQLQLYLTACLLTFYEQTLAYQMKSEQIAPFLIEKPLAVFVGSSVNAVRSENNRKCSDVVTILRFIDHFIGQPHLSRQNIARLLQGTDGLTDANGVSLFANRFSFLKAQNLVDDVYQDMLANLFNTHVPGAQLHLDNLKGVAGEIGLRVGSAEYFGVINVGDEAELIKLCAAHGIHTAERDFAGQSLFDSITSASSKVNMLIGSKKFTEGWNCWRVSTMGLMNLGRSEGTQVIQLFGRGVRLKGKDFSLKRACHATSSSTDDDPPEGLALLETLNIFGIRADYMEAFRKVLSDEGLPVDKLVSIKLPVLPTIDLGGKKLKYIRVKEGKDFVKEETVVLKPNMLPRKSIKLDYYPRIQALHSHHAEALNAGQPNEEKLTNDHLRFVDWQAIYFALLSLKRERQWWNLGIDHHSLKAILSDSSWYTLLIPAEDMTPGPFAPTVALWQEIAVALLRMYAERAYGRRRDQWTSENIETVLLDPSDPNLMHEYSLRIHKDLTNIIHNIQTLKDKIDKGELTDDFTIGTDFEALYFSQHLYRPLLCFTAKDTNADGEPPLVEIKPVALNQGEKQFVADLKHFYAHTPDFFQGKELYLLRNESRRGIGFFEAKNFYPDFILWLVQGRKQHIAFVDPKGITHLDGFDDLKIRLAQLIRTDIEPRLADKAISLNSYIVSNTSLSEVQWWCGQVSAEEAQREFASHHVYFQQGAGHTDYVQAILDDMLGKGAMGR